jgi:hypothetical protein
MTMPYSSIIVQIRVIGILLLAACKLILSALPDGQ